MSTVDRESGAALAFAPRVLGWFERHGRKHLPWQNPATPYRVWVSEIMLQQTQVRTVLPYFERFMQRFASPAALADAPLDDVLAHWSGLGYYARARNLHASAGRLVERHGGDLPLDIDALQALPGIGRSTAGAILALGAGQRHPILDGNVKRVLCRHAGVAGWPGATAVARTLWQLADERTPSADVANYTQAMMDLGATVCTRSKPTCLVCPVNADCVARTAGRISELPASKPRKAQPLRETHWLVVENEDGKLLLQRRPAHGIWGGLWSFAESATRTDAPRTASALSGGECEPIEALDRIEHGFTHFRLTIHPLRLRATGERRAADDDTAWFSASEAAALGLPAPARRLLEQLTDA